MKIIQVIDLDGTTVKVDETNPAEPKIVSALQFDLGVRKNVAIGDIAELVFAKPMNANVEAVCIGYKGTDGKYYGIEESMFAPAPEPEARHAFISVDIPSDNDGGPTLKVLTSPHSDANPNEFYTGADLREGIYATFDGGTDVYHFTHVSIDDAGVHTLRADKVYTKPLGGTLRVQFGVEAAYTERAVTLSRTSTHDGLSYVGAVFTAEARGDYPVETELEKVDHL